MSTGVDKKGQVCVYLSNSKPVAVCASAENEYGPFGVSVFLCVFVPIRNHMLIIPSDIVSCFYCVPLFL